MEQKEATNPTSGALPRQKPTTDYSFGARGKRPRTHSLRRRNRKGNSWSPNDGGCRSPLDMECPTSQEITLSGLATPAASTNRVYQQQNARGGAPTNPAVTSPPAIQEAATEAPDQVVAVRARGSTATLGSHSSPGSPPLRPSAASSRSPSDAAGDVVLRPGSPRVSMRPSEAGTSSGAPSEGIRGCLLPESTRPSEAPSTAPSVAGKGLLLHESSPTRTRICQPTDTPLPSGPVPPEAASRRYIVVLSLTVAVLVVAVAAFVVLKLALPTPQTSSNACQTHACRNFADRLLLSVNQSVKPCQSFTDFVCDGWRQKHRLSVWEQQFGGDVLNRLTTTLLRIHVPATGQNEEQQAAALYRSCRDVFLGKSDQLPAVKEALSDAGIVWPRPSRSADALRTLFYTSLKLGWGALLDIDVKLSGEVASLALNPGKAMPYAFSHYPCSKDYSGSAIQRNYFDFLKNYFRENGTSDAVSYEDVSTHDCDMLERLLEVQFHDDRPSSTLAGAIPRGTNILQTRWAALSSTFNLSLSKPLSFWIAKTNLTRAVFTLWADHGEDTFHLFLSWCTVQVAALYSNRDLVLNFFDQDIRKAEVYYGAFCLSRAVFFSKEAPFAAYISEVLRGSAEAVARELTLNLRRSFFRRLSKWDHFDGSVIVLGNWSSLTKVFRRFEREKENPMNGSSLKRDMDSSSFVSNWQNSVLVKTSAEVDDMQQTIYYLNYAFIIDDEQDIQLMPYSLSYPLFDVELPASVNYGGFGAMVVSAIGYKFFHSYLSANASLVMSMLNCMQVGPYFTSEMDVLNHGAALVGLGALVDAYESMDHSGELPLPGFEQYTGLQTLFIAYCYSKCGGSFRRNGNTFCNLALQYVPEFAEAFECSPGDPLNPLRQCRLF